MKSKTKFFVAVQAETHGFRAVISIGLRGGRYLFFQNQYDRFETILGTNWEHHELGWREGRSNISLFFSGEGQKWTP